MMRLLGSPSSPFVRKVRAFLAETGHEDAVEVEMVKTSATGAVVDILTLTNPTGKIPALIREDGPAIYDSRVICRYLDDVFETGLYPRRGLYEVLTLEAMADAIMEAGLLMVYEGRYRPPELRSTEWVEGQWRKVDRALDAIEARWLSHLAGPQDMSHIAMGCALGYLDLRHPERDWRAGRPALAEWADAMLARPAMRKTAPTP